MNRLDGTLPAELGKLTDLEELCARRPCAAVAAQPSAGPVRRRAFTPLGCRDFSRNRRDGAEGLSGTIGGWIGSMAKLKIL